MQHKHVKAEDIPPLTEKSYTQQSVTCMFSTYDYASIIWLHVSKVHISIMFDDDIKNESWKKKNNHLKLN